MLKGAFGIAFNIMTSKNGNIKFMNSETKPKPIQIRLPQDLEDSLRYVAHKTRSTLNSVVIECLREHLPTVSQLDLAVYDGVSPFNRSEDQLIEDAYGRLGRYQKAVQLQIEQVLQLASLLNAQAANAGGMMGGLLNGAKLKVPENNDGTIPDMQTAGGISPEILDYIDASNLLKNETAIRKCRKAMARHQYDAAGEWELVKELLRRLDPNNQVTADPSSR